MDQNTKRVIDIIISGKMKNLDILVFPESILNNPTAPVPLSKSDEGHPLCVPYIGCLTIFRVLLGIAKYTL